MYDLDPKPRRRAAVMLITGVILGTLFLQPVSAHVNNSIDHIWGHIKPRVLGLTYSKSQSDSRYYTRAQTLAQVRREGHLAQRLFAGGEQFTQHNNTTWAALDGAAIQVVVPAGQVLQISARFTAESQCTSGGTDANWCSVKITVDGNEMFPLAGSAAGEPGDDFAFDSTNQGNELNGSWESHSVERYTADLTAGTYVVAVNVKTTDIGGTPAILRLDDWTLVVDAIYS